MIHAHVEVERNTKTAAEKINRVSKKPPEKSGGFFKRELKGKVYERF